MLNSHSPYPRLEFIIFLILFFLLLLLFSSFVVCSKYFLFRRLIFTFASILSKNNFFFCTFRRFWEFYMRWSYFIRVVTFCMEFSATREKKYNTSKKLHLKWQTEWLFLLCVVFSLSFSFSLSLWLSSLAFSYVPLPPPLTRFSLYTLLSRFACQCVPSLSFNYGLMRWR